MFMALLLTFKPISTIIIIEICNMLLALIHSDNGEIAIVCDLRLP